MAIENRPVKIVDSHIKNGGSFHSYVNLKEGNSHKFTMKAPFSYGFPILSYEYSHSTSHM